MGKCVLAVLAEGFEEIEAITPVDVLRRLNVDVTVASLDGPMIAAICAAPAVVLHPLRLLGDERVACYPAFQRRLDEANRTDARLCVGDRLITAAGPGVAMDFALALAERLKGGEKAGELARAMLVER